MTEIRVGIVEVHIIEPRADGWRVLVLRRGQGTRCTGAWEVVHGRIEEGERPEEAALREVREETGLELERLYSVTCQPFYLHRLGVVQMAVVFAGFVASGGAVRLGAEHDIMEWVTVSDALERLVWPRSRSALLDAVALLGGGDAGPAEDVLRVI